jgi:hypothetical protein
LPKFSYHRIEKEKKNKNLNANFKQSNEFFGGHEVLQNCELLRNKFSLKEYSMKKSLFFGGK